MCKCPHLPILENLSHSASPFMQAPFLLLRCQWAEGQTWLCPFKMTMTCFLQTSQAEKFLFTVFLRTKNNSRGDRLLQQNNDSSSLPTHSSWFWFLFLNIKLAKVIYPLQGTYWSSLLTVVNLFKSKWQSNLNAALQSQSASSAGSIENHSPSVWWQVISYLQCPDSETSRGNLFFWIQQGSNHDDKDHSVKLETHKKNFFQPEKCLSLR